jgi:ankyrin repeat protein
LQVAALCGYVEEVQCLLANAADIDARDEYGNTALHHAITSYHDEVAYVLIDNNADIAAVSILKDTPLHLAALTGQPELIRAILARPLAEASFGGVPYVEMMDLSGRTALANVFQGENVEAARLLLGAGAEPALLTRAGFYKVFGPIMHRSESFGMPIFKLLTKNGLRWDAVDSEGWTLLHTACCLEDPRYCKAVLKGLTRINKTETVLAHKNKQGVTALLASVSWGNLAVCELLMQYGADAAMAHGVRLKRVADVDKLTPLEYACSKGCAGSVKIMLEYPDQLGDISRALWLAAREGHLEICRSLIARKVDVDHRTNGMTYLQAAAYRGHFDTCVLFLEHDIGVWPSKVTKSEALRHFSCEDKNRSKIMDLLEEGGAFAWG